MGIWIINWHLYKQNYSFQPSRHHADISDLYIKYQSTCICIQLWIFFSKFVQKLKLNSLIIADTETQHNWRCINSYLFDAIETLRPCTRRFVPCSMTLLERSSNITVLPIYIIALSLILRIFTLLAQVFLFLTWFVILELFILILPF